jgi:hypothetical protein
MTLVMSLLLLMVPPRTSLQRQQQQQQEQRGGRRLRCAVASRLGTGSRSSNKVQRLVLRQPVMLLLPLLVLVAWLR